MGRDSRTKRLNEALESVKLSEKCEDRKLALREILKIDRELTMTDGKAVVALAQLHTKLDGAKGAMATCLLTELTTTIDQLNASSAKLPGKDAPKPSPAPKQPAE